MNKVPLIASLGFLFTLLAGQAAQAIPVIAYEWTEGGPGNGVNSPHVSHHTSGGPVLADDFIPVVGGRVTQVDWWGSAPLSGSPSGDSFEITFHPDDPSGLPNPDTSFVTGILSQHSPVLSAGSDPDGDGVFMYSAQWTQNFPGDLTLAAGTQYWFSVANHILGWTWADAGGLLPTVGTEIDAAVMSLGAPGTPHFGPWTPLANAAGLPQQFAFRIWVDAIPEPSILALLGVGLIGIGYVHYRRWRQDQ